MSTEPLQPHDRLRLVRKRLGKGQREMALLLELSVSGYRNYETGEREIPPLVLAKARDLIDLSPRWVMDGVGDMLITREHHNLTTATGVEEPRPISATEAFAARYKRAIATVDNVLAVTGFKPVPLLYEGLKTLAFIDGLTNERIALLISGIEQQLKEGKA